MKRVFQHFALWQAVCVLLVIIVLGYPFAPITLGEAEEAPVEKTTITDYRAEFDVAENGDMAVTERLTVDFPDDYRHGIFRFFDRHDPNAPHLRRDPHDISVEVDPGLSLEERLERVIDRHSSAEDQIEQARADNDRETLEEIADEWYPDYDEISLSEEGQGRYTSVRIGSQYDTVPAGEHVYILKYEMSDVLLPDDDAAQFIWNLIPSGWNQPIEKAELTVNLPGTATNLECTVGADRCDAAAGDDTDTVTVSASDLPPRTPVAISTDVDVAPAIPTQSIPWTVAWEPMLGDDPETTYLNIGLAVIALVAGLWLSVRSRDPIGRTATITAPPTDVGPAQAAYVLRKRLSPALATATILHAAALGTITIERKKKGITLRKSPTATYNGIDHITRDLALWVKAKPRRIDGSSDEGRKSGKWLTRQNGRIAEWADKKGYLVKDRWWTARLIAVILAAAATIALAIVKPTGTIDALAPALFATVAIYSVRPTAKLRRTEAGAKLAARVAPVREAITDPSPDHNARDQFNDYLPWAVALACTSKWTASSSGLAGSYVPHWLNASLLNDTDVGSVVTTTTSACDAAVASSISAYSASISSGSTGGGGFSGGVGGGDGGGGFSGGGDGGGGSW